MKFFSHFKNKTLLFLVISIWFSSESQLYAGNHLHPLHFDLIRQFAKPDSVLLLPTYIPEDFDMQYFSLSENIVEGNAKSYYISYKNNQYLGKYHYRGGTSPTLTLLFRLSGPITTLFSCEPAYITIWNFRNPHIGKATMCNKKLPMGFLGPNYERLSLNGTHITIMTERMNIQVTSTLLTQEEVIKVLDSIQVIPKDMKKSISETF